MKKPSMQYLTISEIKRLLAEIPVAWQRLMLLVAFTHGLRVAELVNLRGENIQYERLYCERKKGSLATKHTFWKSKDPDLDERDALIALAKLRKPTQRLFPMSTSGVAKLMKRAGTRAGIDPVKLHPHALKHSCVRALLRSKRNPGGLEINEVQAYVGHASIGSTGRYTIIDAEDACALAVGLW